MLPQSSMSILKLTKNKININNITQYLFATRVDYDIKIILRFFIQYKMHVTNLRLNDNLYFLSTLKKMDN